MPPLLNQKVRDPRLQRLQRDILILSAIALSWGSGAVAATEVPKVVKVGVVSQSAEPFVVRVGQQFDGISVAVWQDIARRAGWDYQLIPQSSIQQGLDAVQRRQLDVFIGPISITAERLEQVEFTQPFYIAHIDVLLPSQPPTPWQRVRPFFGTAALSSFGVLVVLLFLVGNLIWLAERRVNPEQFPASYPRGVSNGMWFALVTLTTVGYGDRTPITRTGRFVAGVWMLIALVSVSSLTAGLASAFTIALSNQSAQHIRSPNDLRNMRMAVLEGTTGERWGQYYQARLQSVKTLEDATQLMTANRSEGVIFDRPVLAYYLSQNPAAPFTLGQMTLATENYGFALPLNSPLRRDINLALVDLTQQGHIQAIANQWLQDQANLDGDEPFAPL